MPGLGARRGAFVLLSVAFVAQLRCLCSCSNSCVRVCECVCVWLCVCERVCVCVCVRESSRIKQMGGLMGLEVCVYMDYV